MNNQDKMYEILDWVRAESTSYTDWLRLGMACKSAGVPCDAWESWSMRDPRYKKGDCRKRWKEFGNAVGIGTAVYIAKQYGFAVPHEWAVESIEVRPHPIKGNAADAYIEKVARWAAVLPKGSTDVTEEEFGAVIGDVNADRAAMAKQFISAVFNDFDVIGLCRTFDIDPTANEEISMRFERAGVVKQWIEQGHDDFDLGVFSNYIEGYADGEVYEHTTLPLNTLVNPVKPNSDNRYNARVESIASFRHVLVESDTIPLYDQYKVLTALNLPITSLVYSGNKSLHALVRVDAKTVDEYRERFEFIRDVCAAYGMQIDEACKNPNRWTRTAGALRTRCGVQTLIGTNIGSASWADWYEDIKAKIDTAEYENTLAEYGIHETTLAELNLNPPAEVPHIIRNALKAGREGILIASSKAGKSWLMLELAAACADGGTWLGYDCNQCRVGIVNMELGEDDIFERMHLIGEVAHPENIRFLNCAGVCSDLEHLQTAVERFATRNKLDLLIIDPVYSLMGKLEENSNGDVMQFLERLAQIRRNTGCASFMTHHTSKGSQDGKTSIDMGSGAGAFARHPDVIITMQTATPDNLKGIKRAVIDYDAQNGVNYFVMNETLRSFPSRRKDEIWRAEFPNYERVNGAGYDRMGSFHAAQTDNSIYKYRTAAQECIANGDELTKANIAARAGVSRASVTQWAQNHPDEWEGILENTKL